MKVALETARACAAGMKKLLMPAMLLVLMAGAFLPIGAEADSGVSLSANRSGDGTTAEVSWSSYDSEGFEYYRFVVCPSAHFIGGTCANNVFVSDAYFDASFTGSVTATGLDRYASYGVILQVWRTGGKSMLRFYDTIPALRQPTPEPTKEPTPEPTKEPTPEPTKEPTPEPTKEPTPEPTREPTPEPTREPTPEPTREPTPEPTTGPAPFDVSVKAVRDRAGTSAEVSWTKYAGRNFDYYRFVICPSAHFIGGTCANNVFRSDAYYDAGKTGPVAATGLDPQTGYGVILQVWRTGGLPAHKFSTTIPAVTVTGPTPTPTPGGLSFGGATVANQTWATGGAIGTLTLPRAVRSSDGPSATIGAVTYSLSPALPEGLSFDAADRTVSGTPAGTAARTDYTYTAAYGADTVELEFWIEVLDSDDLPRAADSLVFHGTISNQTYTKGTAISTLTLPTAGGSGITYTLVGTLPSGLTYNASNRTITGTPTQAAQNSSFTWHATQNWTGSSGYLRFTITVNSPLTFGSSTIADQSYHRHFAISTLTLPQATGYGTITYSVSPSLPSGLSFSAANRTITGTPTATLASTNFSYTATEADGSAASLSFKIAVTVPALSFSETVADQSFWQHAPITPITLPAATSPRGSSIQMTETFTGTLPAGLTYNAASRTISGTPTAAKAATTYTWTVSAAAHTAATLTFTITVKANNDVFAVESSFPDGSSSTGGCNAATKFSYGPTVHGNLFRDSPVDGNDTGTNKLTLTGHSTNSVIAEFSPIEGDFTKMAVDVYHATPNNWHTITITATDPRGASASTTWKVKWADCTLSVRVAETLLPGHLVPNYTLASNYNPNNNGSPSNFTIHGDAANYFTVEGRNQTGFYNFGRLRLKSDQSLDYETKTSISGYVQYTTGGVTAKQTLDITVLDRNAPGKVTGLRASRDPARPHFGADLSWDKDSVATSYEVQYKLKTAGSWSAVTSTANTKADKDNLVKGKTYQFRVRAKNSEGNGGWSDTAELRMATNERPVFPSLLTTRSIVENSAVGTNVGAAVTATDGDGDTLVYTMSYTDASKFTIDAASGQIKVKTGYVPDYEAKSSYQVRVHVSDRKGPFGEADSSVDNTTTVTINVTDINEPPDAPGAPTVARNAATPKTKLDVSWTAPTMTGKPAISDYDVQYKKSGASTWTSHSFTGAGATTTISGLSAKTTYDVQVLAKNDEGSSGWSPSGSKKTAGNTNPSFPATATRSVAENSAAGTNVGAAVTTTDADGDTLTYSLHGTDKDKLNLNTGTGQITVKAGYVPDYEAKTSYTVRVGVSDKKDAEGVADTAVDDKITVTINVTDVKEPPDAPGTPTVAQNGATPKTKLDVSWIPPTMTGKPAITDYDVRYRSSVSNWTSHAFTGAATSTTLSGLTMGTHYHVQVKAKNDEGESGWSAIGKGTTQALNAPPTFSSPTKTLTVAENVAVGTSVGTVTATDPDGDALTYTLEGVDAAKFDFSTSTAEIKVKTGYVPDYETKKQYAVIVKVSDGKDGSGNADTATDDDIDVTIDVTDLIYKPRKLDGLSGAPKASDPAATLIATWNTHASDPDYGTITSYGVNYVKKGGHWIFQGKTVTVWCTTVDCTKTKVSAELPSLVKDTEYQFRVAAYNSLGIGPWSDVAYASTAKNDMPKFTSGTTTRSVAENSAANANVGAAVTATDAEGDPITYSLSGTDASKFTISTSTGQIKVASGTALNYEKADGSDPATAPSFSVTVEATDSKDNDGNVQATPTIDSTIAVTITVSDANEPPGKPAAPTLSRASSSSHSKIDASWTAPSMTGKPPITQWNIRASSDGGVSWVTPTFTGTGTNVTLTGLSSQTSYQAQVRARNDEGDGPWSDSGDWRTDPDPATRSVAENSPAGTSVGAAVTASVNLQGHTEAYRLGGTDASKFDIGSTTGQITVKSGTTLDYETRTSYSVKVHVDAAQIGGGSTIPSVFVVAVTINVTDVNEPPELPATTTRSIAENSAANTNVGAAFTATDPEGDTLEYSLSGTDASKFTIVSTSGQIKVKSGNIPDYEAKTSYSVTVGVSDKKDGSGTADTVIDDTIAVTIDVTDVNEPPAAPAAPSVAANSTTPSTKLGVSWTAPTMTGKPAISDYDVQYRQSGGSTWTSHSFTGTGRSTTLTGLATGKSYEVQVRATNDEGAGGWSASGSGITDANAVSRSVAENSAANTNVGAAVTAASNPNNYTLTHTMSGTDASKFTIESGTGRIKVKAGTSLDYEAKSSYSVTVTVRAAAAGVQSASLSPNAPGDYVVPVTINVTDVAEPPGKPTITVSNHATSPATKLEVSWTAPTMTGKPAITDYDVQYRKVGDSSWTSHGFTGTSTSTTLTGLADGKSYEAQVRAVNDEGNGAWSDSGTAITQVGGVTRSIAENSAAGTNVGAAVTAPSNPNSYTLTHSLSGTDASEFEIASDTGQITVGTGTTLDYETKSSYSVTVTVKAAVAGVQSQGPNAPGDYVIPVTINVTNVNERPEFDDGATTTRGVLENSAAGANVGAAVTATDQEGDALYYSLTGADAGKFAVGQTTGQITVGTGTSLDHEAKSSYSVTVNVSDRKAADGTADTAIDDTVAVTINVTDVAEPPAAPAAPSVWQHSPSPKTELDVSWTAPDVTGKPAITDYDLRYKKSATSTWSAWAHAGTATTARLTGLTEDTSYDVQVRAVNDEGDGAWSASGSARTQDKNVHSEFPSATTTRSIAENSAAGTNVGAPVTATDTENHTLYYTLSGVDGGKFDVGLNTGQVKVKTGHVPNYEAKTTYSVTVQVSDRKDKDDNPDTVVDDTIEVTVYVTDVAEPPAKPVVTVAANAASPTSKLDVSWTAPDMTGKPAITDYDVRYRLSGGSTWTDLGFTGTTTSTSITGLTAGKSYDAQVRATNAEGTGDWSNSGIAITTAGGVTREIAENSPAGTNVGAAVTATSTAYTYSHSLSGADAGSFTIESATGQVKVKSGTTLDYESNKTSYSVVVTVRAASAGASVQSASVDPNAPGDYVVPVTINVTDVSETPEFPDDTAARSVAENSAAGTNVGAVVTATDQDGDTLSYSLAGTDADEFEIGSGTGQITVKSGRVPDYEAKSSYSVTVQVTDNEDDSGNPDAAIDDTIAVTINVTDVAEPPAAPDGPTMKQNADTPSAALDVWWDAPDMTGKPAVTDYDVRYRKTGTSTIAWTSHSFTGAATSTTIAGLAKGTRYEVQVKAKNDEGESGWSTSGSTRTRAIEKASVQVPENAVGGTAVSGSLPAVDSDGHAVAYAITSDEVVGGGASASSQGGTEHDEFTINSATGQILVRQGANLDYEQSHSHVITVTASHADRNDPDHDMINAVITVTITINDVAEPPAAPDAPDLFQGSDRYRTLDVSWTAPDMTGKPAITDYDVEYRLSGGTWTDLSFDGTGTSDTITGLTPGVEYEARVRASNAEGTGLWSDAGAGFTKVLPSADDITNPPNEPDAPSVSPAGSSPQTALSVTWTAPADNGSAITGYNIRYRVDGAKSWSSDSSTVTGVVISGLTEETTYEAQVQAINGMGKSPWSDSGRGSTTAYPAATVVDEYQAAPVQQQGPIESRPAAQSNGDAKLKTKTALTFRVAENSPADTSVGTPVEATDADGDALTWSITGADEFTIDASTGQIMVASGAALDYETKNSYAVTVGVSDGLDADGNADASVDDTTEVTILVTDVAEPPARPDAPSVSANAASPTSALTVGWSAPGNGGGPAITGYDLRYRAKGSSSWTSDSSTVTGAVITGLASDTTYEVQVRAVNDEGVSEWSASGEGATEEGATEKANAAPIFPSGVARSVSENAAAGTLVGDPVTATDADGDALSYSLSGASEFAIDAGTGQISVAAGAVLDYETKSSYAVTVSASDGSADATVAVTIRVTDVDESAAVAFTSGSVTRQVSENSAVGTLVGDPVTADGDALSYTLSGASEFAIDSKTGQISVATGAVLDYESVSSYGVTVRASDGSSDSAAISVTIGVTDVDEPPSRPDAPSVSAAADTPTSALSVGWDAPSNGDGPAITGYDLRYRAQGDTDWQSDSSTATGAVITGLASGTTYEVQVRAVNAEGASPWSESGEGATAKPNAAPTFPSGASREIAENSAAGTPVGEPVAAVDADGDALSYTLSGASEFVIDAETGQISVAAGAVLDHETVHSYSVTVSASDGSAEASVKVTIRVADVDEPPSRPDAPSVSAVAATPTSALSVEWDAPANGGGPAITGYDLRYRAEGAVSWTSHPVVGTATSAAIAGLASDTTYEAQVRAVNDEGASEWSESGEGATAKPNAAPAFPSGASRQVSENSAAGTAVGGPVTATDADGDALSYTLSGASEFAIDSETGQISVAAGASLDYETKSSYSVTVSVSDGLDADGNADAAVDAMVSVTIGVTDVDESVEEPNGPPSVTSPADKEYRQGETIASFAIAVSDPDGDAVEVSLSGLPGGLSYSGGKVSGTVSSDATAATYTVTITASDGVNAAVTAEFDIEVSEPGVLVLLADLSLVSWLWLLLALLLTVLWIVYRRRRLKHNPV